MVYDCQTVANNGDVEEKLLGFPMQTKGEALIDLKSVAWTRKQAAESMLCKPTLLLQLKRFRE